MFSTDQLPKIEVYTDNQQKWRWRVTAPNGNIIGASTEGYQNKLDCIGNMNSLGKQLVAHAEADEQG